MVEKKKKKEEEEEEEEEVMVVVVVVLNNETWNSLLSPGINMQGKNLTFFFCSSTVSDSIRG